MGTRVSTAAVALLLSAGVVGCASDSSSTGSSTSDRTGVGQSAPISKVIVAKRFKPWHGRPLGTESIGSKGCFQRYGQRPQIGLFTDEPAPSCIRITGHQQVLIVNRTTAFRRSEGRPLVVRFGPYSARLLPQQAALFGPVGRFFGRGFHPAIAGGRQRLGVLVLPKD